MSKSSGQIKVTRERWINDADGYKKKIIFKAKIKAHNIIRYENI